MELLYDKPNWCTKSVETSLNDISINGIVYKKELLTSLIAYGI